jgi:hypothetical protein
LNKRVTRHHSSCRSSNRKVYKYIRANGGFSNWEFEIVERYSCGSRTELFVREGYWILELAAKLNTYIAGRTRQQYREDTVEQRQMYRDTHKAEKKKYRDEHKEQASEVAKIRYDIEKEEILAKDKIYRESNKEKIAARDAEKFKCECGGNYSRQAKARHLKTNKHKNYLNQKTSNPSV